jgi:hypothetical protein
MTLQEHVISSSTDYMTQVKAERVVQSAAKLMTDIYKINMLYSLQENVK